ncbi:MAG: hypothetical protein ACTSUE_08960, partial [Promethearchaeota archaeon]
MFRSKNIIDPEPLGSGVVHQDPGTKTYRTGYVVDNDHYMVEHWRDGTIRHFGVDPKQQYVPIAKHPGLRHALTYHKVLEDGLGHPYGIRDPYSLSVDPLNTRFVKKIFASPEYHPSQGYFGVNYRRVSETHYIVQCYLLRTRQARDGTWKVYLQAMLEMDTLTSTSLQINKSNRPVLGIKLSDTGRTQVFVNKNTLSNPNGPSSFVMDHMYRVNDEMFYLVYNVTKVEVPIVVSELQHVLGLDHFMEVRRGNLLAGGGAEMVDSPAVVN